MLRTLAMILTLLLGIAAAIATGADTPEGLPRVVEMRGAPMYPATALRLNGSGRVLIEFSISQQGRVVDARLVATEPTELFGHLNLKSLDTWRFDVPSDWQLSGGAARKFRLSLVYFIKPCPDGVSCTPPEPYEGDLKFDLSHTPLPKVH